VADLLFRQRTACELYKRPWNTMNDLISRYRYKIDDRLTDSYVYNSSVKIKTKMIIK
jgi:hypothetical protein